MPWSSIASESLISFFRNTASATWRVGADGYVVDVPEWTGLTGQSAEEAAGDGWIHAVHPEDRGRAQEAWRTAVAHNAPYNTDYRLRCADGIYRWFNARAMAILDHDGQTQEWVGVLLAIAGSHRFGQAAASQVGLSANAFTDISPSSLRAARGCLNWTAETLAERAGLSRSTVRRLENDDPIGGARAGSIRKVLGVLASEKIAFVGERGGCIIGVCERSAVAV